MKIVVCVRQGIDGTLSPFDSCAYEEALRIGGAEVILLSMGPVTASEFMSGLGRLGASRAILLSDRIFAGADTLATAYTLSTAIRLLAPDYVFCGRQTMVGDTGQTGPMLAEMLGYDCFCGVAEIKDCTSSGAVCTDIGGYSREVRSPALLTFERISELRLPSIRSRPVKTEIFDNSVLRADASRCGLEGSGTRVIRTEENRDGKRACKFINASEINSVITSALSARTVSAETQKTGEKIGSVLSVGEEPAGYAGDICDNILVTGCRDTDDLCKLILEKRPDAVLFGSDSVSKMTACRVAVRLGLGLCADCTRLDARGGEMLMIRPALSGTVTATIRSTSRPAMCTVRTVDRHAGRLVFGAGMGAASVLSALKKKAKSSGAELAASRRMVDEGYMQYPCQVGLSGRTVSPDVYVAFGISGAVHHISGISRSGTVIAVNSDRSAPVFEYADYGIVDDVSNVLDVLDLGSSGKQRS